MIRVDGFQGSVDRDDDVDAVRYSVSCVEGRSHCFHALYLGESVLVSMPSHDQALAVRYLHRVADQALALIAEIHKAHPPVDEAGNGEEGTDG